MVTTALAGGVDFFERSLNCSWIIRPDETRDFPAILKKNQRRPELHREGAPQPPATCIGNPDMADRIVSRERPGDERFCAATVPAPRVAELEHCRAREAIHLLA